MIKFEPGRARNGRDVRRAAARHGWDHVLRCLAIAGRVADGDLLHGIILISIIQANTATLRQSGGDQDHDTMAGLPDDSQRTPISAYAIAKQLGLPYETVRRHVVRLIDDKHCVRVGAKGGVIVPTAAISTLQPDIFVLQSLDALRSLVSELDRIGAVQIQPYQDSERSMMIG